ncbi:MAG: hypothetical protein LUP94_01525 [Candidatus Methanomethylicus sp.]|nr:hypothetical protein [Candidatus Methanomethylicus sp.]
MKFSNLKIVAAILPFLAFFCYVFYQAYSQTALLVGWDTPFYVYSVNVLQSDGLWSFLRMWEFHRFVFALVLYFTQVIFPNTLFLAMKILPFVLALAMTLSIGLVLQKWFHSNAVSLAGIILSFVWITPYMLASNLFAQLLTVVLLLLWLAFGLHPVGGIKGLGIAVLFFLAALSHLYTVIFFVGVYSAAQVTMLLIDNKSTKKGVMKTKVGYILLLGSLAVAPIALSILGMGNFRVFGPLAYPSIMASGGIPQIQLLTLFVGFDLYLIPFVVLAFGMIVYRLLKPRRQGERLQYLFLCWWIILAVALALFSNFVYPSLVGYAERMLIITPVPIMLALGLRDAFDYLKGTKWEKYNQKMLALAILGLFLINAQPTLVYSSIYLNSFETGDLADQLDYVRSYLPANQTPLFIIDRNENLLGESAELLDNFIGAYVGVHYTYIGKVERLVEGQRTVYFSARPDYWSGFYFSKLNASGILASSNLTALPVVLMSSLDYGALKYKSYFTEIWEGIYVTNYSILQEELQGLPPHYIINAYADRIQWNGLWYGIERDWSVNQYVLEAQATSNGTESVSYRFYSYEEGIFQLNVKYYDYSGSHVPLVFLVDNSSAGTLEYSSTNQPLESTIAQVFLTPGWHNVTIKSGGEGSLTANIDYLELIG